MAQVCWIWCDVSDLLDPAFKEWPEDNITPGTGFQIDCEVWESQCSDV